MFHVFEGETADEVWRAIAGKLCADAASQPSRAGDTRELLHAAIGIRNPRQRWVFARTPPLNPGFAIAEVVWLLSGRRDAAFLNYFNRELPKYAGTGEAYHGAYGYRLRRHLDFDQLLRAFEVLRSSPASRQVVLQIWDATVDMPGETGEPRAPDIPCNVMTLLKIRNGKLELTEIVRSNDAFRGLPYNIVQFTTLQEVLAGWLGVELGEYAQLSDSLHAYSDSVPSLKRLPLEQAAMNTDNLALPKPISDESISTLASSIERMTSADASGEEIVGFLENKSLPQGFYHLLCVVSAEALRRRKLPHLAAQAMVNCKNPALQQLWARWTARVTALQAETREEPGYLEVR